jgi:hypothetical protein
LWKDTRCANEASLAPHQAPRRPTSWRWINVKLGVAALGLLQPEPLVLGVAERRQAGEQPLGKTRASRELELERSSFEFGEVHVGILP